MANTHILPLLLQRIYDKIVEVGITNVLDGDATRLNEVKIGRYQTDPAAATLRASIMGGDLDDPKLTDHLFRPGRSDEEDYLGFTLPAREIGGSQFWVRNGTISVDLYFVYSQANEDTSRSYAYTILGRLQNAIETIYVSDLEDDFGEVALKIFHVRNTAYQSGGPPNSYIWRIKLYWACLTERSEEEI